MHHFSKIAEDPSHLICTRIILVVSKHPIVGHASSTPPKSELRNTREVFFLMRYIIYSNYAYFCHLNMDLDINIDIDININTDLDHKNRPRHRHRTDSVLRHTSSICLHFLT